MSNYSKESVLEWVNSSEAKAAKYEQEAKVRITFNSHLSPLSLPRYEGFTEEDPPAGGEAE